MLGEYNDPKQSIEWLEETLKQMEQNGEIAIVIGHMSSGVADCLSNVAYRLRVLYTRYQHVIRMSLFGHTHGEEFEVIRAYDDYNKTVGLNFLTSSFTTFTGHNPSFRVITLDVETKLPIEMKTYTLNMAKANKNDDDAKFFFNHELTQSYGLQDLSPSSLYNLSQRFINDEGLTELYIVNKAGRGPEGYSQVENGCDETCRRMTACHTSNSVFVDARNCYTITDQIHDSKSILSFIFEFIFGKWVIRH